MMGRAERRAAGRVSGPSPRELAVGLAAFERNSERFAAVLGARLPDEWVQSRDVMGLLWRRGAVQVRATLTEPGAEGWAQATVSVSVRSPRSGAQPSAEIVREVARTFIGPSAEDLPQVEVLPGGLAMMVECDIMVRPVGQA